ncbi:protein-glutamate O-methyltransferase isoform X3 [Rhinatrema bivittatum]|uniref:protein-glutamate O-methyltransferase isoform X3 n=1 Tax=Rhinatrema bivittatum TaxID=194408 RepID=UPI00112CC666|nr:protein-glutamate O-methyltransferase isoform X3 [Rhinatrema bivittatum]
MLVRLQNLRAIVPVPVLEQRRGHYSIYFVVPKKEGSFRPILDLKEVNRCLWIPSFRMETLRSVIASVRPGTFLASLNLTEAYLHIGIRKDHQKYLRFFVLGQHFQFQALPFGLATAPRIFTKIMVVVAAQLRREGLIVHPYLDDWLIRAKSEDLCRSAIKRVLQLLHSLGWVMYTAKSQLNPSQSLEFLGALFDTQITGAGLGPIADAATNSVGLSSIDWFHGIHPGIGPVGVRANASLTIGVTFPLEPSLRVVPSSVAPDGFGEGQSGMVVTLGQSSQGGFDPNSGLDGPHHGREPLRLGSSVSATVSTGTLVRDRVKVVDQSPGKQGGMSGAESLPPPSSGKSGQGPVRQRDYGGVHQSSGGDLESSSGLRSSSSLPVGGKASSKHSRVPYCRSRPRSRRFPE